MIKRNLLDTLKIWKDSDPKLLRIWTKSGGAYAVRKAKVHAEEFLILLDGEGYKDGIFLFIEFLHPIMIDIDDIHDFDLKYEQIGRMCEDEYDGCYRFEDFMRRQEKKKAG